MARRALSRARSAGCRALFRLAAGERTDVGAALASPRRLADLHRTRAASGRFRPLHRNGAQAIRRLSATNSTNLKENTMHTETLAPAARRFMDYVGELG